MVSPDTETVTQENEDEEESSAINIVVRLVGDYATSLCANAFAEGDSVSVLEIGCSMFHLGLGMAALEPEWAAGMYAALERDLIRGLEENGDDRAAYDRFIAGARRVAERYPVPESAEAS